MQADRIAGSGGTRAWQLTRGGSGYRHLAVEVDGSGLEVRTNGNGNNRPNRSVSSWARTVGPGAAAAHQDSMLSEPRAQTADDFQVLVAAHRAGLWRVAYRLTGNRDDAEDLLQESLIEAFQAFGRFQMGTAFERWVYRIMTRTFIDKFRRRKRLGSVPLEEISRHGQMSQLADFSMDPQQISERTEWSEPVQAALSRLAPAFRAVVIMCDAEGLSYEEASRVLACPMGTVRSRLHRARDQLRSWLRPVLRPMRGG